MFLGMLALWCTKPLHGLGTGLVAWMGVVTLFIVRADEWADASGDAAAWDALIWLGGLITMAGVLEEEGVGAWVERIVAGQRLGVEFAEPASPDETKVRLTDVSEESVLYGLGVREFDWVRHPEGGRIYEWFGVVAVAARH